MPLLGSLRTPDSRVPNQYKPAFWKMVKIMTKDIDKFRSIRQYPASVDFFSLLFEKAGIRIIETGEEFSCYHRGTHINFESPLDETSVDYVLDLNIVQVEQILQLVDSREVDEVRQYKILHTLFAFAIDASVNPFHCLKAASNSSTLLSNSLLRRLLGWKMSSMFT